MFDSNQLNQSPDKCQKSEIVKSACLRGNGLCVGGVTWWSDVPTYALDTHKVRSETDQRETRKSAIVQMGIRELFRPLG